MDKQTNSNNIMLNGLQLMHEDTCVLTVNFNTGEFQILNECYIPFQLRGTFKDIPKFVNGMSMSQIISYNKIVTYACKKNRESFMNWLASRVMSLSRKNSELIYSMLNMEKSDTILEKARIAIKFRAVSVLDNYWVKLSNESVKWGDVNIRHRELNDVIANTSLHGIKLSMRGGYNSPDVTTGGRLAKAWRVYPDGNLWLHKLSDERGIESSIEVEVSNILDKTNVSHCHYETTIDHHKFVCACPLMANDNLSILMGSDFITYCHNNELDYVTELIKLDKDNLYKMWIVDYLMSIDKRDSNGWGVYYNPKTMEFIGICPMFNNDGAFNLSVMYNRDGQNLFKNISARDAAHYASRRTSFKFIAPISKDDFITESSYESFLSRVLELGISLI